MPSEYTVTIKVEPFVRRFLYSHFGGSTEEPFVFAKRHKFNRLMEDFLHKPPVDYKPENYGDDTMVFAIPHLEYKNEAVYNWMPESLQRAFVRMIVNFIYDMFEIDFRNLRRNHGLTKEESIETLKHKYGFLPEDNDRLIKDYDRWIKSEYNRRYKRKKKINKRKKFA